MKTTALSSLSERGRQARSARHEGAGGQAWEVLDPSSLLKIIYQRLCSVEVQVNDLNSYLKGIPADNQIQLRDAILAHLSGDRTLIEEYVKQNKGH